MLNLRNAQTTSQKPRTIFVLQLQKSGKKSQIPPLSKANSEGPDVAQDISEDINTPGSSNWQLPPESEDQPDLPTDTEYEGSDLEILDDEEEADGSDDEQGKYITEKRSAIQYAEIEITLGEEFVY
ncbi:hypothetical protein BGX38DRAFT_1272847 [Terfezia claveryi]|nr:hypothetical protein BGX38DRAFT_1272847 [Terfezia claveryi]